MPVSKEKRVQIQKEFYFDCILMVNEIEDSVQKQINEKLAESERWMADSLLQNSSKYNEEELEIHRKVAMEAKIRFRNLGRVHSTFYRTFLSRLKRCLVDE